MKIVILAGGTGSIQLQTGLYELERNSEGFDVKILINAYDAGLSTGIVRKVMDGKILGPSDARKNQTTRLKLENPDAPLLKLLDTRFTAAACEAKQYCMNKLDTYFMFDGPLNSSKGTIKAAIECYFNSPDSLLVDYEDFSLANIIYAGLAKLHGYSLQKATDEMAKILDIKPNVILNDDTPLYLGAVTKSGFHVTDEGDIVNWGKMNDPFVDVMFQDINGNEQQPNLCLRAIDALVEADLIILSSGTQWSSLIPTYASIAFSATIKRSKARIIMVMNRVPDNDSPGQTASDIVKSIIPRYFEEKRVDVIIDKYGDQQMTELDTEARDLVRSLYLFNPQESMHDRRLHHPGSLVKAIGAVYFGDLLDSDAFVFDYDNTLVGRGNTFPKASKTNQELFVKLSSSVPMIICTGNTIKAVDLPVKQGQQSINVYADGGANLYSYTGHGDNSLAYKFTSMVDADNLNNSMVNVLTLTDQLEFVSSSLVKAGLSVHKVQMRGDIMLALKPIEPEYRDILCHFIKMLIDKNRLKLDVRKAGRTTIEVSSQYLSKASAINDVRKTHPSITYVGDEFTHTGNDVMVYTTGVKCLNVNNPSTTTFFLHTMWSINA